MDLNQLRTFVKVAHTGNITQALEELYLTQPAISRQIQALEAAFKVTLFDRTGRGMRLTDAGAILRSYAERCLALVEDCEQAMAEVRVGTAGKLVIGVGGTHPMYELPGWIQGFTESYPSVDISIRTGRSREIISAVCGRELDIAFVRVPVAEPGVCHIDLYTEPILLISDPGRYGNGAVLSPAQLQLVPLILFPQGTSFRSQIDAALGAAGITPRVRMETDSVEEIRRFVAMGIGLAFLPASFIESDLASQVLAQVDVASMPILTRQTSLIYLDNRYHSNAMRGFISLVTGGVIDIQRCDKT